MAGGYLYGWYATTSKWIKIKCNAAGKVLADISAFLENPPTEDLATKAPTSEWAFDHKANAAAHHVKYTDANARAAINDIFDSMGQGAKDINMNRFAIWYLKRFNYVDYSGGLNQCVQRFLQGTNRIEIYQFNPSLTTLDVDIYLWRSGAFMKVMLQGDVTADILTHKNIAAAHHAKYTDLEAQTACNLDGNLYLSIPGIAFDAQNPDIDNIFKNHTGYIQADADGIIFVCSVNLPDGATITSVMVYGNANAEVEYWTLQRIELSDATNNIMSSALIGTSDATITNPVVDNSLYAYSFYTTSLDTNDQIYGARITYTL